MTSFAHVDHLTQHPGVVRAERLARSIRHPIDYFDSARAAGFLLLAAIVAALLVVANQVVETWSDGHLLAAWIVMWTVILGGLALFAAPVRRAGAALRLWLQRRAALRRQAVEDAKLWRVALTDERVMADISRAMSSAAAVRNLMTYY